MATYGFNMEAATATAEPLVLRVEEAAELLACCKSQVYALVKSGQLPSVKLGKSGIRIPRQGLVDWINGGGVAGEDLAKRRALILAAKR
jgi:excisionase family DNA binding protein